MKKKLNFSYILFNFPQYSLLIPQLPNQHEIWHFMTFKTNGCNSICYVQHHDTLEPFPR